MLHPIAKYLILLLDHSKPSRTENLQAIVDCFGIRINLDIAVIFLNIYWPISVDYSSHFEEVLLGSHEFPVEAISIFPCRLNFETL
jgi:hypothetical protein